MSLGNLFQCLLILISKEFLPNLYPKFPPFNLYLLLLVLSPHKGPLSSSPAGPSQISEGYYEVSTQLSLPQAGQPQLAQLLQSL